MNVVFDFKELSHILKSFYDITGLRYSAVDSDYRVVCASCGASDFCARINATPEGHLRCVESDMQAAKSMNKDISMRIYRCHAGLTEVVIPIVGEGETVAYLFVGQILNTEESVDAQWQKARESLAWYKDRDSLETPFRELNALSEVRIRACANILRACSKYIWLDGVVKTAALSDIQRIYAYIEANYKNPITLDAMASALSMSKTKLCALVSEQDTTVMKLVRHKRITEAKKLLEKTEYSISVISDMVGISDYNYFTKVFRSSEGKTPRAYRKLIKSAADRVE